MARAMKCLLIILFTYSTVYSQSLDNSFEGNLRDSKTDEPIPYALLYIDGTTFGVTSNENGDFEFNNLSFPIQIEISHLSYNPKSILIDKNVLEQVVITLNPRAIKLESVLIMGKSMRARYVKKFKKWFVGDDSWGKKAKLLNEDALVFFDDTTKFRVGASEPLIIESVRLGYTIHADLKDFQVKYDNELEGESGMYIASYYFQEIEKDKYIRNRLRAYYNSSEHFLKSLYNKRLSENGFELKNETINDSANQKEFVIVSLDSSLFQGDNNEKLIVGLKNKNYYILYYFKDDGSPLNLENDSKKRYYKVSSIKFEEDNIVLRPNGTTPGSSIVFSGAIGEKKVGAMLPSNYQPPVIDNSTITTETPSDHN